MNEKIMAWCSLWRAPGVGVKTFQALLAAFSSPEAFFNASTETLQKKVPNFPIEKLRRWQGAFGLGRADVEWLEGGENRHILCWDNPQYPALLKEIADPPPVLFVLGDLSVLSMPQIGIVGSRQASEMAKRTGYEFSSHLAQQGFVITSGLALGIDGVAHQGALEAKGKTLAVVATGLDRVYPARHARLAAQISQQGAIVSEFPIGTAVRSIYFPRRNRIISGLSLGILVVEASLRSGSLITARLAAEQGREVFAIPNSIHNPLAKGCHHLIKQGAKLVETAGDILEELSPLLQASITIHEVQSDDSPPPNSHLDPQVAELLAVIGYDVCSHDDLVTRLKLTSEEVSAMLSELELEGYLVALGGGLFQRLS